MKRIRIVVPEPVEAPRGALWAADIALAASRALAALPAVWRRVVALVGRRPHRPSLCRTARLLRDGAR